MGRDALVPTLLSIAAGALLFALSAWMTGLREPWDSSLYWTLAYPAAILAGGAIAYLYPERPWRWPLWLFETQFVAMCIRNGELGNLWPLGMALFAVVAIPAVFVAGFAARFGRVRDLDRFD